MVMVYITHIWDCGKLSGIDKSTTANEKLKDVTTPLRVRDGGMVGSYETLQVKMDEKSICCFKSVGGKCQTNPQLVYSKTKRILDDCNYRFLTDVYR